MDFGIIKAELSKVITHPFRILSTANAFVKWFSEYDKIQKSISLEDARIVESELDGIIPIEELAVYAYHFHIFYVIVAQVFCINRFSDEDFSKLQALLDDLQDDVTRIFKETPTRMQKRRRIRHPLLGLTFRIDKMVCCYPSMHVGFSILAYLLSKYASENFEADEKVRRQNNRFFRNIAVDICQSTLKIEQHSIIDVIGGIKIAKKHFEKHFGKIEDEEVTKILLERILPQIYPSKRNKFLEWINSDMSLEQVLEEFFKLYKRNM